MVKLYLIFVLLAICAVIVGSRWLPIWAAALVVPGTVLFFIWLTWRLIRRWWRVTMATEMRKASAIMRGAVVTIHRVELAAAPPDFLELSEAEQVDGEVDGPDRWVSIDMTVRPDPAAEAVSRRVEDDELDMGRWQPSQFSLVPIGTETDPLKRGIMAMWTGLQGNAFKAERIDGDEGERAIDALAGDPTTAIEPRDEDPDEQRDPDEFMIEGPARVRVLFAIPAELPTQVSLRYLTLDLAEVTLPA
ncbi:MAG: hypothetical protein R3B57_04960 [Phycisphaerales bacterium]